MQASSRGFITGHANNVGDLHLTKMLHLKILRSPYARGRILKVKGDGIISSEFKSNLAFVGEGSRW